ncbi:pheromone A receptor-domain-containing protein [Mycena maculata]|uniref:Pheromone A receptor-domain-containing protein n=1 Tax=Mycena maculata TaxID=230809 RepID=A0AAD7MTM0_9AGAR|nr:pheromone A receptor-domain-containing protein [Mycena maculata]
MSSYVESYPLYPVFAFISFVIVLIPLPWHFQAWNAGTCLFMIWTALACLNNFINSIVWHNNVIDWAPVWCDISTRLTIGISVAIPAASLCINRRLYKIAACQTVSITKAQKRRAVMVDCAIGVGIPVLQMILQYVVQGHRYNIMEDIGCYPTTYNTPLAYPLSYLWPNVIGLISACYCILSLREFNRRRAQFALLLSASSTSPLSLSRYFRLMALATIELVFNTPISAYGLYLTVTHDQIRPWISWANTHFQFSAVDLIPSIIWRADRATVVTIELSRWAVVFCAFVFFAFFGFAAEARKHYRLTFWAVAKRLGYTPPADGALPIRLPWTKAKSSAPSALPVSIPRAPVKQRPESLTASLADTRTDYDDTDAGSHVEKADYLSSPAVSSGSAPPEYMHDIELGAYQSGESSPSSEYSHRTLDSRVRPHIADAFFPAAAITRPPPPSPRSPRPSTWPSLPSPSAPQS